VRNLVSPGRARPQVPKLSVLFRRSYAFSLAPCADRRLGKPSCPARSRTQPLSCPGSYPARSKGSL
jgi:hypothetical protein